MPRPLNAEKLATNIANARIESALSADSFFDDLEEANEISDLVDRFLDKPKLDKCAVYDAIKPLIPGDLYSRLIKTDDRATEEAIAHFQAGYTLGRAFEQAIPGRAKGGR